MPSAHKLVLEVAEWLTALLHVNLHRCIADHQREGQFPFLDEEVVGFLQQLPVWNKVMDLLQAVIDRTVSLSLGVKLGVCLCPAG